MIGLAGLYATRVALRVKPFAGTEGGLDVFRAGVYLEAVVSAPSRTIGGVLTMGRIRSQAVT
jgi:hypothetical protein